LCNFDFENILDLVINHLIVWDEDVGIPKDKSGVFGVLDARSAVIEEQVCKNAACSFLDLDKGLELAVGPFPF
jgi:hypothetical protein